MTTPMFQLTLRCELCDEKVGLTSLFSHDQVPLAELRIAIRVHVMDLEHLRRLRDEESGT